MSKNFKILLFLVAFGITAVLILIIVISQKSDNGFMEKINNISMGGKEEQEAAVDLAAMSEEYKEGISGAFAEFSNLNESADLSVTQIKEIKNRALDLKLPGEFRGLHIDFILALTRMEDFLETGAEDARIAGEDLIEKIKSNYPWLTPNN